MVSTDKFVDLPQDIIKAHSDETQRNVIGLHSEEKYLHRGYIETLAWCNWGVLPYDEFYKYVDTLYREKVTAYPDTENEIYLTSQNIDSLNNPLIRESRARISKEMEFLNQNIVGNHRLKSKLFEDLVSTTKISNRDEFAQLYRTIDEVMVGKVSFEDFSKAYKVNFSEILLLFVKNAGVFGCREVANSLSSEFELSNMSEYERSIHTLGVLNSLHEAWDEKGNAIQELFEQSFDIDDFIEKQRELILTGFLSISFGDIAEKFVDLINRYQKYPSLFLTSEEKEELKTQNPELMNLGLNRMRSKIRTGKISILDKIMSTSYYDAAIKCESLLERQASIWQKYFDLTLSTVKNICAYTATAHFSLESSTPGYLVGSHQDADSGGIGKFSNSAEKLVQESLEIPRNSRFIDEIKSRIEGEYYEMVHSISIMIMNGISSEEIISTVESALEPGALRLLLLYNKSNNDKKLQIKETRLKKARISVSSDLDAYTIKAKQILSKLGSKNIKENDLAIVSKWLGVSL